jgi:HAD superfamily hydrolase (TIGR01490 family)
VGRAAFFDLDRTLLQVNSGKLWFRRERAAGRLPLRQAVEAGVWLGLYSAGLLGARKALTRAVRTLVGKSEDELAAETRRFFEDELVGAFAPGGLDAVAAHKRAGDPVVLLTSASLYLSRCVQEHLELDDILCLRMEVVDGRFTGRIDDICYGDGKVTAAEAWARDHDVDLDACWFYTDSFTDLPMLNRVGRPMVVAPDPRLTRIAKKRGWPILDWTGAKLAPGKEESDA